MSYRTYGNIALCHKIANHLETLKLDAQLSDRDRADLDEAVAELNRRLPPKRTDA